MCQSGKWTQTDVAKMLSRDHAKLIDQSMVSRAWNEVSRWKGEPKAKGVSKENRPRTFNMDTQKAQHVVEDTGSTLSEQIGEPSVPIRNGLPRRKRPVD